MTHIFISGGSHGIGLACAERFAAAGNQVTIVARDLARLAYLQQDFSQRFAPGLLTTISADLTTQAGCQMAIDELTNAGQIPDLLINNVGRFSVGELIEGAEDQLADLLNLNVLAAHRLGRGIIPAMVKRGKGHLITIGSVAGDDFPPGVGQYTVSKLALRALHQCWAQELADSPLRGTLIVPGATRTRSWDGADFLPEQMLQPEAVAEMAFYHFSTISTERWTRVYIRP